MPMLSKGVKVGTLYYLESEEQNAIKIGYASDLYLRVATLQTGNPAPLKLLWTQNATYEAEQAIHRYLKPFRIAREWYPDDGLVLMVMDMLGYELLDKAEAECLTKGTPYDESVENQIVTIEDVRRVLPDIVKEHSEWIAAGRPADDEYELAAIASQDMAQA